MDTNERDPLSRRQIVGGVGIGLAAASAAPALAQGAAAAPQPLVDPATKYPRPPFERQQQPWPGLARDMRPRPDHGETSYRGSGRLAGRKAVPIPGDIREEAFCRNLVERAVQELGGLDILVSNAALQLAQASILDVTSEQFDRTIKTNIYAPFWIIKAAVPHLRPGSAIVATTSEQATDPTPDLYDYAQTKAATTNFVRSLGKQLAAKGIRVNGVAPGPIWTPLQVAGGATMDKLEKFGGMTPMGRPGQPVELAGIYVQLASAEGSYATGQVYGAAGGSGLP